MAFNWKGLLGTVAPTIATALGGPLAGAATKMVSTALLGREDGTEAEISTALETGNADTLLKLKEVESNFLIKMKELGVTEEQIAAGDRADARNRAVKQNDLSPNWIGLGILGVWAFINVYLVMAVRVPVISDMVLGRILGMIDAVALAFVYYIYGTSAGSKGKDGTIKDLANK